MVVATSGLSSTNNTRIVCSVIGWAPQRHGADNLVPAGSQSVASLASDWKADKTADT